MRLINEQAELRNMEEVRSRPQPTSSERVWLARALDRGRKSRFSEDVTVTPGMAAGMLVHNMSNRPITRAQVNKHIARLQRGEFILHHHGIAFANTGVLNDGQHRLTAIMESGISGKVQVTFGAERAEFGVIDQGKARTAAHILAISGVNNTSLRAAIAAMLLRVANKNNDTDSQSAADYALAIRGPLMDDAIATGETFRKICPATIAAVAYYWIATKSKHADKLPQFLDGLASGEGLTGVKLLLREWLQGNRFRARNGQMLAAEKAAGIICAWNSFVSTRKRVNFNQDWSSSVSLPEPK